MIGTSLWLIPAEQNEIIIRKITAVKNPFFVSPPIKDELIIASLQKIYLVNWRNNQNLREICTTDKLLYSCIFSSDNKLIAAIYGRDVCLYDQDGNKKWEIVRAPENPSCTFTASNTLYVLSSGTVQNSKNDIVSMLSEKNSPGDAITAHPIKEQIFYTKSLSEETSALCTINIIDDSIKLSTTELPKISHPNKFSNKPYAQAHSFTNDVIALNYPWSNQWNLYDNAKNMFIEERLADGCCCSLAFHPNESLIALLKTDGFVEIYDFINKKTIKKTTQSLGFVKSDSSVMQNIMNFSQDGNHLAIITFIPEDKEYKQQCFILSNLY